MYKSMIVMLFVVVAQLSAAAAQNYRILSVSSSWITSGSDAALQQRTREPVDAGNATSIEAATHGNREFEFSRGHVILAPEPSTFLLFGSGLLLIAGILRRWMRGSKLRSRAYSRTSTDQFPAAEQCEMNTDREGADALPLAYGALKNVRDEDHGIDTLRRDQRNHSHSELSK